MRVALISLAGEWPVIAGKPLAERQAEFALAAGAERVLAVGNGAGAAAIALRHAVERAGARFQAVRDGRELLGATRADDILLVLAPGLLPDAPAATELLGRGAVVLVLPANIGAPAGFERIDLQRAWAGALVVPGSLVEALAALPADMDPAAALLRAALQARVAEKPLPEGLLADGSWTMLRQDADAATLSRAWLGRHLPAPPRFSTSQLAAGLIVRRAGLPLLGARRTAVATRATAALGFGLGVGLAWLGFAAAGLALIALAVIGAALAENLHHLQASPRALHGARRIALGGWLADAALIAAAAAAIDGTWPHRLFPPLVLTGALRAGRLADATSPAALFADRALVALLLAAAALLGQVELAAMGLALVAIALNLPETGRSSG